MADMEILTTAYAYSRFFKSIAKMCKRIAKTCFKFALIVFAYGFFVEGDAFIGNVSDAMEKAGDIMKQIFALILPIFVAIGKLVVYFLGFSLVFAVVAIPVMLLCGKFCTSIAIPDNHLSCKKK